MKMKPTCLRLLQYKLKVTKHQLLCKNRLQSHQFVNTTDIYLNLQSYPAQHKNTTSLNPLIDIKDKQLVPSALHV